MQNKSEVKINKKAINKAEYWGKVIGYNILPTTDSHKLVFGIAWINEGAYENDIQTWFAADPTVM